MTRLSAWWLSGNCRVNRHRNVLLFRRLKHSLFWRFSRKSEQHRQALITVGGISKKVVMNEEVPEKRQYLCYTLSFNHDIVNSAPAVRFEKRFLELRKSGDLFNEALVRFSDTILCAKGSICFLNSTPGSQNLSIFCKFVFLLEAAIWSLYEIVLWSCFRFKTEI